MKAGLSSAALLAGIAISLCGQAHASEGWYGRADIGHSTGGDMFFSTSGGSVTIDMEDGWSQSVGGGYAFSNGVRIEGEISRRANDLEPLVDNLDEGDITATAGTLNVFFDFNRDGRIQPYVGAGLGFANLDLDAYNAANPEVIHDSDSVMSYQLMVGVGIVLSEQLTLDIGYRHFEASDLEFDGTDSGIPTVFSSDYNHQSLSAGLRWSF